MQNPRDTKSTRDDRMILHTKFGNAKIDKNGYYVITSKKEGNNRLKLHRLIFEDFYNFKIPKGYIIHHKNGNKLDNCILNLQMIKQEEHIRLHHKGKKVTNETKKKQSKRQNTTGYFRVHKQKNKKLKQGFEWCYRYYDNGKRIGITSIDLDKLKQKVKDRGLEWFKLSKKVEEC